MGSGKSVWTLGVAMACLVVTGAEWWENIPPPVYPNGRERRSVTREAFERVDSGLPLMGRVRMRAASEIRGSKFSIDCAALDRDYAKWENYAALAGALGAKHVRFMSGWAKTEKQKGVYDFAWFDRNVRGAVAMGMRPWITLGYGNAIYASTPDIAVRLKELFASPEGLAAFLDYCRAVVRRYGDCCDEWEIWNEPFDQGEEYGKLFLATARAIREIQPQAKCFVTAIRWHANPARNDYRKVLECLKRANALDLADGWVYHPYDANPDTSYATWAEPLARLVAEYGATGTLISGECGCPSQLEWAHAMSECEWTEYRQAKWDLRRSLGDAVRDRRSNLFQMIDLQYPFMLQSFGMIRSNARREVVYRRPSYFAQSHLYALFDDETRPVGLSFRTLGKRRQLSVAHFTRRGTHLFAIWRSDIVPSAAMKFDRATLDLPGAVKDPVWVELITGKVHTLPPERVTPVAGGIRVTDLPFWDAPVLVAERDAVPTVPAR